MGITIQFTGHKWHRCAEEDCRCYTCQGLLSCVTCGGGEASLPTHCPQRRMDYIESTMVQQGMADYEHGHWVYRHVPLQKFKSDGSSTINWWTHAPNIIKMEE